MGNVELYIEGNKIELFKEESINIKSSVQDINDISKVFADLSLSFTVPASKDNNSYFKHYYDADIVNGFDARTKKEAEIYLNSILYKKGKIRFLEAKLKDNEIYCYKIQFEGDVIKIKDVLGDDKLRDLDLSAYNHEYNSANVKQGLESSLFGGAITYPLISPIRRFVYDSGDNIVSNDSLVNIHYNNAIADNSINYNELKPSISYQALISAIETDYGLDFVGDFFNRDYFTKSYLWLNKDEGKLVTSGAAGRQIIDWDNNNIILGGVAFIDLGTNILTVDTSENRVLNLILNITPSVGFENVNYRIVITRNGQDYFLGTTVTGNQQVSKSWTNSNLLGETTEVIYYIETDQPFEYTAELEQLRTDVNAGVLTNRIETTSSSISIDGIVDVAYQMPDITIYDFLVGIIKEYNIALTGNSDGSINWEVLPEWYNKGIIHKGFEKYIDVSKKDIKRGKLNNEFKFEFEESTTILGKQFDSNNGIGYGDLEATLKDENGDILDGTKLEIKLPFEQMVFERILDLDNNTFTDLQYGYAVDKEQQPVVTKPLRYYNNNIPVNQVGFLNDIGTLEELNTTINIPSSTVNVNDSTSQSNCFGAEISTYNFTLMEQSLYNSFYKDYVTDMFSNQRRMYTFDAIIPEHILVNLNLNDRLIILNRRYIINSINSNLTDGKTKLELLNDIYTSGDLITDQFYVNPSINFAARWEDTYTATVYSNRELKILSTDEGDGIFITIKSPSDANGITTINYTVSQNNEGLERTQSITIQDKDTLEIIKLFIVQSKGQIEWSNNVITFDNNIITWDNN